MGRNYSRERSLLLTVIHFIVLVFLVEILSPQQVRGADGVVREWSDATGTFRISATMTETDGKVIRLLREDGRNIEVPVAKLSFQDRKYVLEPWFKSQNASQYEVVQAAIVSANQRASGWEARVCERLIKSHVKTRGAPYAGLVAGAIKAAIMNETLQAESLLKESQRRVMRQREFDPEAQTETLVAILNNLGICAAKKKKADSAASFFIRAAELVDEVPAELHHNAKLLSDATFIRAMGYRIGDLATQERIPKILAMPSKPEGVTFRPRFVFAMHSADPSSPPGETPARQQPNATLIGSRTSATAKDTLTALSLLEDNWCIFCTGRGFMNCTANKCKNGRIPYKETYATGTDGAGRTLTAQRIRYSRCKRCDGKGGLRCNTCNGNGKL